MQALYDFMNSVPPYIFILKIESEIWINVIVKLIRAFFHVYFDLSKYVLRGKGKVRVCVCGREGGGGAAADSEALDRNSFIAGPVLVRA